ncbi:hypothetical protein B5X24_HaOG215765 [Helicoverpa armigera]|uniref:Ubiquitin-like domain-containing protein n=1 Tax=Helicoverpa armigera TaxID=29058 RepID=A0A2W1AZK2_HELAM|nr:hypothetical protein B5X24_HaOG215765 [Helicoverpa armigera]
MVKHKEDSESEDADAACEPRFRVRVCMQRVFRDERARAYVCVSPRRRVAWLQRRLRRLFRLPPHRLLSRGHLLPPDEPLALLDRDDPVECVPPTPPARRARRRQCSLHCPFQGGSCFHESRHGARRRRFVRSR